MEIKIEVFLSGYLQMHETLYSETDLTAAANQKMNHTHVRLIRYMIR